MSPESQDKSGYYWILNGPNEVYCGMSYTGSSFTTIILKLVTSQDTLILALNGHVFVWEEDGEE